MGSCLSPVLANIIMTELEKIIIDPLIHSGVIPFYSRFVDDTLVLIKSENLKNILDSLNSFHPKIQFTVDDFPDGNAHFLDLRISDDLNTDIYRKDSFTGQYTRYDSFKPWHYKIGWARSLYFRSNKLCSSINALKNQIVTITRLLSWNGFPKYVRNALMNRFKQNLIKAANNSLKRTDDSNDVMILIRLQYMGTEGENLVRKCIQRLKRCLKDNISIRVTYSTKRMVMFCSNKDKTPDDLKSHCVYKFQCPDRNFLTRVEEHGTHSKDQDTVVYKNHAHPIMIRTHYIIL